MQLVGFEGPGVSLGGFEEVLRAWCSFCHLHRMWSLEGAAVRVLRISRFYFSY